MALLNTSDLIADLNTIISGLSLPSEEEQRLSVLLKSAVNVQEDPTGIISELQSRIESIDNTALLEKFALLMISLSIATEDRSNKVATVNDLPDASTLPSGSCVFVESLSVMVMVVGLKWLGLDGRLLRDDTPIVDAMGWGANGFEGRLGDGASVNRSSPVTVVGGITNWSQVSAGYFHSLGLTDDGITYAWGWGANGQVGDGNAINKSSPVTVVGGITNWSSVSAGATHNLGLTDDGIAYAWGQGSRGRLGDGVRIDRSSPVTVVGGITNWSSISAGGDHSLGIADGIAYAWGYGFGGKLGDGTNFISRSSPVTVIGGITNWSQVSAGAYHNLGVTADGIAYAWGRGNSGILGDGTTNDRSSPVTVVGGITNWSSIGAGGGHSLGVTDTGIAYAWGSGSNGRLGDGTTEDRSSPVTVVGGITNWSSVSAGWDFSLGITDTGIAYAWGEESFGRLGDGTTIDRSSPVTVVGGTANWSQVSAGYVHSLGLKIST